MLIIPAIDIKDNYCVRLVQGRAENSEVFSKDPCEMAKKWEEKGAEILHVVDLDGAFQGKPVHLDLIRNITRTVNIPVQVGGGIRDEVTIRQYLDSGIYRVILGTFLLNQGFEKIESIVQKFKEHIIAGIDIKENRMAIKGWVKEVDEPVEQFIHHLTDMGIDRIIYTDIQRDGMLNGPNTVMAKRILKGGNVKLIASGGISTIDDLYQLQQLENSGLEGAIVGKALYKGIIELEEAVNIFQYRGDKKK